jgi:nicotinamide-nucleotide amidase
MWDAAMATGPVRELIGRTRPFGGVTLRAFGIPESEIAKSLREIEEGGEADLSKLEIVTCLRRSELEVEIRHDPGDEAERVRLVEAIERRHGHLIFSRDGATIDDQVAELLAGKTIVLAESCSGGLMAARLTERPGASAYVVGGVVAYSNEAKVALLGVSDETLAEHGAVSPETAREMAEGARARFSVDVGVGITGIAGPDGGSEDKPVGLTYLAAAVRDGPAVVERHTWPHDRDGNKRASVLGVLELATRVTRDG